MAFISPSAKAFPPAQAPYIIQLSPSAVAAFAAFAREQVVRYDGGRCYCHGEAPQLALALAKLALEQHQPILLRQLIQQEYRFFSSGQRRQLLAAAEQAIACDHQSTSPYAGPRRQLRLATRIRPLLQPGQLFDLEGFCRFGCKDWAAYCRQQLCLAAEGLLAAEEDEAYLAMLRRYCREQSRGAQLRLTFYPGGHYSISEHSQQKQKLLEGGGNSRYHDVIICTLLQLAPQQLSIQHSELASARLISMLQEIFGERLQLSPEPAPPSPSRPRRGKA